jgi:hypothetical protein
LAQPVNKNTEFDIQGEPGLLSIMYCYQH